MTDFFTVQYIVRKKSGFADEKRIIFFELDVFLKISQFLYKNKKIRKLIQNHDS
jgi:hypothetical protein